MRRLVLALGGVALLALAVVTAPRPRDASSEWLSALGASSGGLRTVVVDALFLRAQSLRREGRVDELPGLYETVRDLDPDNIAAVDFLATIYAYDVLPEAPDAEARFGWWREAWNLVAEARELHPDDPQLLFRQSDLLWTVAVRDEALANLVDRAFGRDAEIHGLELLLETARQTAVLPRLGRVHLARLVAGLPVLAALEADGAAREARLRSGEEILALRRSALAEMWQDAGDGGEGLRLDRVFQRGLEAVRAVHAALAAGDVEGARAAVAAYRREVPGSVLGDVLPTVIERGGG